MTEKRLVFDLDILYDDGTKETVPFLRNVQYNTILYEELLIKDLSEKNVRTKMLHTSPVKIVIKNIRNVCVQERKK